MRWGSFFKSGRHIVWCNIRHAPFNLANATSTTRRVYKCLQLNACCMLDTTETSSGYGVMNHGKRGYPSSPMMYSLKGIPCSKEHHNLPTIRIQKCKFETHHIVVIAIRFEEVSWKPSDNKEARRYKQAYQPGAKQIIVGALTCQLCKFQWHKKLNT